MKTYDVIIIGAGFAGLSAAEKLGLAGISTVLIDKKTSLSKHIHTTGIIVHEALKEWDISSELLKPITDVNIISPKFDEAKISSKTYSFFLTATGKVLEEKLQKVSEHKSIDILLGTKITSLERGDTEKQGHSYFIFNNLKIQSKYLILADGAKTKLAKNLGFQTKNKYLAGHEYEYALSDINLNNEMAVFIHPKICKGYIGWVVPGVETVQVGLAVNNGEKLSIDDFLDFIHPKFPFKELKPVGQRSGLIPVGGTCKRVFHDGALVIGDAAGYVSPLTAGGIHTAMRYGSLGADLIEGLIKSENQSTKAKLIKNYQKRLPSFYKKHLLKKLFDLLNTELLWMVLFKTKMISFLGRIVFYLRKKLN